MEIIRISGYTEDEKVEIARRHLIPKQIEAHGLTGDEWSISEGALRDLIRYYTREAGVRNLEREIANLTRKAIKEIMMGDRREAHVNTRTLGKYAGVKRFRYGEAELEDLVGVTTGLAWTEVGGELLSIEAVIVPGKGRVTYTGKLGDVMQESIQAAKSFVQSRAIRFGISPSVFAHRDIHVHVPEGATPKDGPSAGVAMVTSIVSALTGIAVHKDLAMTGELTLRGRILPIGGLKEKLLAALRGGISTVLIPKDNERELSEIPDNVTRDLKVVPVATVDEVLKHALVSVLTPIEWDENADLRGPAVAATPADDDDLGEVTTH
jgi:ATP-dependent Lon protease